MPPQRHPAHKRLGQARPTAPRVEDVAGGGAGEEVGRLGFGDGGGAGGSRRKLAEDAPEGRGEG